MRRRLCCAYNVSRGRAEIGRLEALQAVACRGRVSPTSDIYRRLMVAMTTIGIFCIYDIICRIDVLNLAYLEVWMWFIFQLDCLILSGFMRVFELIFCFAGYDIAICNFEDCRGFGEFYSQLVVASCFVRIYAGLEGISELI